MSAEVESMTKGLPQYPYGAVYFRKTNPPKEEWERDYRVASEDGFNVFRHWFMWSAIEVAPGVYDWEDYDRQFELAERYGIKTIIAEVSHAAPEWAFDHYRHCRFEDISGVKVASQMRDSSVSGGFPGLCLDHPEARDAAEAFLRQLVMRYRDHPALGGYDVWNECNLHSSAYLCYCPATQAKFRTWLQQKYGDLEALGEAWHRHSFTRWEQVEAPRRIKFYPECFDWLDFIVDNAYETFRWRVELVRSLDDEHAVTAHGVDDMSLTRLSTGADHAWRAGREVDIYGFTGGSSEARFRGIWKHWSSVDITRSGADGKPFWSAEMAAGPNWFWAPHYVGLPRDSGGLPRADDIRLHSFTSMAGGAKGIFTNRWRPLLDGPKFGCLAFYNMDGSRTERSEMAKTLSRWANQESLQGLWQAAPVRGDIGILVVDESQLQRTFTDGSSETYGNAVRGAYRGFFDNNIQADWISPEQLGHYDLVYLPCPAMLNAETVTKIADWVEDGGRLVSEGCPAYFGDLGRAGVVQPNLGLDQVFGAREDEVEFFAHLIVQEDMRFRVGDGAGAACGLYRQSYRPHGGGSASGWYGDGSVAVIDNAYGKGRTRLVGTCPGLGYWQRGDEDSRAFFRSVLEWAGKQPAVRSSAAQVTGRLHEGADGHYLWLVNNERRDVETQVEFADTLGTFVSHTVLWGDREVTRDGARLTVVVPAFDAVVLKLG
jgi:beta-galactosidase